MFRDNSGQQNPPNQNQANQAPANDPRANLPNRLAEIEQRYQSLIAAIEQVPQLIEQTTPIIRDLGNIIRDYTVESRSQIEMQRTAERDQTIQAATRRGGGP